jgi:hypothetical protein
VAATALQAIHNKKERAVKVWQEAEEKRRTDEAEAKCRAEEAKVERVAEEAWKPKEAKWERQAEEARVAKAKAEAEETEQPTRPWRRGSWPSRLIRREPWKRQCNLKCWP